MKTRKSNSRAIKCQSKTGFITKLTALTPLIILVGLLISPQLRGSTLVCGNVDGEVWNASGSPYYVNCDVHVSSLMIQQGVEVRFLSNYVFIVEGVLQVKGASNAP